MATKRRKKLTCGGKKGAVSKGSFCTVHGVPLSYVSKYHRYNGETGSPETEQALLCRVCYDDADDDTRALKSIMAPKRTVLGHLPVYRPKARSLWQRVWG